MSPPSDESESERPREVLVTGAFGRCGTAMTDHVSGHDQLVFTYLDRAAPPADRPDGSDTVIGDVADYDAIRPAFDEQDAVIHLAAAPAVDAAWPAVLESNLIGTYNVLEAARDAGVETVVFASSNHVMGMYEAEHAPEIYTPAYGLVVDHTDPVRPDSFYGTSKSFGEDLGRYYVENYEAPANFYALRIGSVREPAYDHPYGDAERGVDEGEWERGDDEYGRAVARMKALWLSRRDFAHLVECCLRDEGGGFDVFYGVSDNHRRWFDLERARATVAYDPRDEAEVWDAPPNDDGCHHDT